MKLTVFKSISTLRHVYKIIGSSDHHETLDKGKTTYFKSFGNTK